MSISRNHCVLALLFDLCSAFVHFPKDPLFGHYWKQNILPEGSDPVQPLLYSNNELELRVGVVSATL